MKDCVEYKNYLVIFIDMLGTQAKSDIKIIYSDYFTFHSIIQSKDGKWVTDGRDGVIRLGKKINFQTHTFSDCAYLLYSYDESLGTERDIGLLIENSLCQFERIILKLLDDGIIFRGGVSYGKAFYEKENNILFGPAINEAFKLEDKLAKNPRILVSKEVADIYNKFFEQCVEEFENPTDDYGKEMKALLQQIGFGNPKEYQGRVIIRDTYDDNYIFNYLNSVKKVSYIGYPEISTFTVDFREKILSYVQGNSTKVNVQIKEKYDWLIEYIQS